MDRRGLPGAELVEPGIEDLKAGLVSVESLLVSIGAHRMRCAGLEIPSELEDAEHRLYLLLGEEHGNAAHSRYNALIRRLVSFERALECGR